MENSAGTLDAWAEDRGSCVVTQGARRQYRGGLHDFGIADGVIWLEVGAGYCAGDSRSPWRAEPTDKQTWRATRATDHGAMAWRGESMRLKISRP